MLFLLSLCVLRSAAESDLGSRFVLEPFDFLFDTAVEAYQKGDWYSVILNMEKALRNRAMFRKVKVQCRLSCANQTSFSDHLAGVGVPIPGAGSLEDLGFFQKILKRAECVSSCELDKLGSPTMHQVTEDVQQEFSKRSPYNYLQVAYFKVGRWVGGVDAAGCRLQAVPACTATVNKSIVSAEDGCVGSNLAKQTQRSLCRTFHSNCTFLVERTHSTPNIEKNPRARDATS